MLVQFKVSNYRSFRDPAVLSMVAATRLHSKPEGADDNLFRTRKRPGLDLLKVGAVFGANASGKSNLVRALAEFTRSVRFSTDSGHTYRSEAFAYEEAADEHSTEFEIVWLLDDIQYRYGYSVQNGEVLEEWLYEAASSREATLFERRSSRVRRGSRFHEGTFLLHEGQLLHQARPLFLSQCAQVGEAKTMRLRSSLEEQLLVILGLDDPWWKTVSLDRLQAGDYRAAIPRLLRSADTGIDGLLTRGDNGIEEQARALTYMGLEQPAAVALLKNMLDFHGVLSLHSVRDAAGSVVGTVPTRLESTESDGTLKLLGLAGVLLDRLRNGGVLVVDELDARFHPLLTRGIIHAFQSPETNRANAQLVFTAHDAGLIEEQGLRRDQIWFTEKDPRGRSQLYSLAEIKGVRRGEEQHYLRGRYGGVPFLQDFQAALMPDADETDAGQEPTHATG